MENEKQDEILRRVIRAQELLKEVERLCSTQEATLNVTPNLVPFDQVAENMNGAVRGKLINKRELCAMNTEDGNWFAFILENEKNEKLRIAAFQENAERLYPKLIPRNTYDITEVEFEKKAYNNEIEGTVSSSSDVIDVSKTVKFPDIYVKIKDIQIGLDFVNVKGQITKTDWKRKPGKKPVCYLTLKDDTGQIVVKCWSHHDKANNITQREGDVSVEILGATVDKFHDKYYLDVNDSAILRIVD